MKKKNEWLRDKGNNNFVEVQKIMFVFHFFNILLIKKDNISRVRRYQMGKYLENKFLKRLERWQIE